MSDRDALRYAVRRAALLDAVRARDPIRAARAAARLRVDGLPLAPAEFARARDARRRLGRAIVGARLPVRAEAAPRHEPAIRAPMRSRRRLVALAMAGLLALLVLLFGGGPGLVPGEDGGAPAEAAAPEPRRVTILTVSRGRTVSLPAEVVVAEPSPTPSAEPTPSPTAAPTAAAPATAGTGTGTRTGAPGPGGGGGGAGGSGGGSGSGSGAGGGGLATPTPRPTATPPVPPPGYSRLNIVVIDFANGRRLPDVCVVIGTQNCGPGAPHTDARGEWSADVAASSASTLWDISFVKDGYRTQFRQITLPGGRSLTYYVYLRRR